MPKRIGFEILRHASLVEKKFWLNIVSMGWLSIICILHILMLWRCLQLVQRLVQR